MPLPYQLIAGLGGLGQGIATSQAQQIQNAYNQLLNQQLQTQIAAQTQMGQALPQIYQGLGQPLTGLTSLPSGLPQQTPSTGGGAVGGGTSFGTAGGATPATQPVQPPPAQPTPQYPQFLANQGFGTGLSLQAPQIPLSSPDFGLGQSNFGLGQGNIGGNFGQSGFGLGTAGLTTQAAAPTASPVPGVLSGLPQQTGALPPGALGATQLAGLTGLGGLGGLPVSGTQGLLPSLAQQPGVTGPVQPNYAQQAPLSPDTLGLLQQALGPGATANIAAAPSIPGASATAQIPPADVGAMGTGPGGTLTGPPPDTTAQMDVATSQPSAWTPPTATGVDWQDETPQFKRAFQNWYTSLPANVQQNLTVESAYRTSQQQARAYARYQAGTGGLAAPPGRSLHQVGAAADVTGKGLEAARESLASPEAQAKFGLRFPFGSQDPGHLQLANAIQTTAVAQQRAGQTPGNVSAATDTASAVLSANPAMADLMNMGRQQLRMVIDAVEKANPNAPAGVKFLAVAQLNALLAPTDKSLMQYMLAQNNNEFKAWALQQRAANAEDLARLRGDITAQVQSGLITQRGAEQEKLLGQREAAIDARSAANLAERTRMNDARIAGMGTKGNAQEQAQLRLLKAQQQSLNNQAARLGGWAVVPGAQPNLVTQMDAINTQIEAILAGVEKRAGGPAVPAPAPPSAGGPGGAPLPAVRPQ